jgi:hypothetical protein
MDDALPGSVDIFAVIGYIGAAVVIFGVFGELKSKLAELVEERWFREGTKKHLSRRWLFVFIWYAKLAKSKTLIWEAIAILIVVAGLAVEWLGGATAEIMQSRENAILYSEGESNALAVAGLNKQAADEQLQAAKINEQIAEMRTNVASLAPANQPIMSVEAPVSFFVVGTGEEVFNPEFLADAAEDTKRGEPANLLLESETELGFSLANNRFPGFGRAFPMRLHCDGFETSLGHERIKINNTEVVSFELEFGEPDAFVTSIGDSRGTGVLIHSFHC